MKTSFSTLSLRLYALLFLTVGLYISLSKINGFAIYDFSAPAKFRVIQAAVFFLSALMVFVAFGLFRQRNWARIFAIVIFAIPPLSFGVLSSVIFFDLAHWNHTFTDAADVSRGSVVFDMAAEIMRSTSVSFIKEILPIFVMLVLPLLPLIFAKSSRADNA